MPLIKLLLLNIQSSVSNPNLYKYKEHIISELLPLTNIELNSFL